MSRSSGVAERALELAGRVRAMRDSVQQIILGQETVVDELITAMLAGGHVLLEGLPGLGKTRLVHAVAEGIGLGFSRIQFTPDLMPSDVTGTRIVDEGPDGLSFRFQRGPIFSELVLADEINRATPKTQSALLEAMQEHSVTVGETTHQLPKPFHVIATQNPIELEGTFPLPEAQLDRFLYHVVVKTPSVEAVARILDATTGDRTIELQATLTAEDLVEVQQLARRVLIAPEMLRYVAELLRATDPDGGDERTQRLVRYGASPRAGQAIVLTAKVRALMDGRPSVSIEDLDRGMLPSLRHRIVTTFEADAENVGAAELLDTWRSSARRQAGLR